MTAIQFRNPEVRMSAALASAEAAVRDPAVTLRELLAMLGEQGLLVFCGVLAAPFLLPVTVPMMSTVLGLPMLLIGFSVMVSRVPWLPERLLNRQPAVGDRARNPPEGARMGGALRTSRPAAHGSA